MKRVIAIILLLVTLSILLTGCGVYEVNSLDEYKEKIAEDEYGFSEFEIDHPKYVLPSCTFLDDYIYLEGWYHFYENSLLNIFPLDDHMPDRSLIILNYQEQVYVQAKQCVLDNIPVFEDKYYTYGDYQFYVNENFMYDFHGESGAPYLLYWCSMVCYNDVSNTIGFLGFHKNSLHHLPEKYINDLENNWTSFIDEYYGEYYDFSK
ncbi:MAG: hypothetical protein IKC58_00485 [Clostridia bacterium]|nr:hypothetical protein [Clostridia bacterium]